MSAQSVVTLNTHAYNPRGVDGGVAKWVNPTNSSGSSVDSLTESVRGPNTNGNTRVQFKLSIPKIATADTACSCVGANLGTAVANIDVLIPGSFTAAERENLQLSIKALVGDAIFVSAVKNLEGSW